MFFNESNNSSRWMSQNWKKKLSLFLVSCMFPRSFLNITHVWKEAHGMAAASRSQHCIGMLSLPWDRCRWKISALVTSQDIDFHDVELWQVFNTGFRQRCVSLIIDSLVDLEPFAGEHNSWCHSSFAFILWATATCWQYMGKGAWEYYIHKI